MSELSHIEKRFLYYTECALATVEGMPKSWSKYQRQRFIDISQGMVGAAMGILGTSAVLWTEAEEQKIPRTMARMKHLRDLTNKARAQHVSEGDERG